MPRLLRNNDYGKLIQTDNLEQIISDNYNWLHEAEQAAQAEMISYMVQRYNTDKIFTDTTVFDIDATYYGKNLVEYTADAFDYATIYNTGDRVVYEDKIYEAKGASPAYAGIEPTDTDYWEFICNDKTLFYAKLPNQEWNATTKYAVGAEVWYNDIVYTCIVASQGNLPNENPEKWEAGITYSFDGVLPTDTTKWTKGDNRNQQIVMYLIDITLYHIHARINPRNIPELRMVRYDGNNASQNGGAIAWLKRVADGIITADLPSLIPTQGLSIQWGSNTKNNNDY